MFTVSVAATLTPPFTITTHHKNYAPQLKIQNTTLPTPPDEPGLSLDLNRDYRDLRLSVWVLCAQSTPGPSRTLAETMCSCMTVHNDVSPW